MISRSSRVPRLENDCFRLKFQRVDADALVPAPIQMLGL